MVKRLFHPDHESWTEDGRKYADAIRKVIAPMIVEARDAGVALRDLEYILNSEICMCISEHIVRRNITNRKKLEAQNG